MNPDTVVGPRLAVTVLVVHDDPFEVLMVRRPAHGAFPRALAFPGGSVEEGESVHAAAVRETLEETRVDLAAVELTPIGHWITPEGAPRRFDTHFLFAYVDEAVEPCVNVGELDAAFWIAPAEAMRRGSAGEELVMLPTAAHLALLAAAGTAVEAERAARGRVVTVVNPLTRHGDAGPVIVIPADAGYPLTQWPL